MILQRFSLRNLPESESFPFNLALIKNFEGLDFKSNVAFLVGENGSGKSTILEALAYAANLPIAGGMPIEEDPLMVSAVQLGKMFSLRYADRTSHGFFVRAEDFMGFVKNILGQLAALDAELEDIKASWTGGDLNLALGSILSERKEITNRYSENLNAMSHGEGFLKFFLARITGKGLYLIDEPEAALSPQRQLSLMALIMEKAEKVGAQFIISTHSSLIMSMPGSQIFQIKDHKIAEVGLKETEHYQLTKAFLDQPELYLRGLH